MVLELIQLIQRKLSYLKEFDTCLEILLITSTIVFVAGVQGEECFCAPGYIWQFGSLALFLGWIDLVLFLKKLPITGIHIIMLQGVLITFLKLVYLPIILIIAFAFPFYMLFSKPEVNTSFHTPALSLMRSLVMTTGELDYVDTFQFERRENITSAGAVNYIFMSNCLWVVFIVVMPILFTNLLVSFEKCTWYSVIILCSIHVDRSCSWRYTESRR